MKKIYYALLLPLALVTGAKAQSTLDFEPAGNGANFGWNVFENGTNPALEFVANPNSAGTNTSANAAKFTTELAGQPWAGCETQNDAVAPWTLSASNCIIKVMVYKDVISDVAVKLTQVGDSALPEIKVANTVINQWEELTFDFSGQVPNTANQIKNLVIFPDFPAGGANSRTYASVTYFDNITFTSGDVEIPEEPMTGAPVPTLPGSQVISLFSNTYTNIAIEDWLTSWSTASNQDVSIDGNATLKYLGLGYAGVDIGLANQVDASEMTHFNVDVWLPEDNDMAFGVKLVDFGDDGAYGGGDDTEATVTFPDLEPGEWHSVAIPMDDFASMTGDEHISQLLFLNAFDGGGSAIAYIDNVYFSSEEDVPVPTEPMTAAPAPTAPAADVISLFSNTYTNVAVNTWHTDWSASVLEEVQIAGNDTKKYSNLNFNGTETVGPNALDVTDMTHFNLDVWSPNFTIFKVKLVDFGGDNTFGGGDDTEHEMTYNAPAQGEWISYHIPLADFTGLMNKEHISQFIIATTDGTSTVWMDNVYFSNEDVEVPTEPMTAAPDPTLPQAQVISMYSGVYTNVAVNTWHTDWSASVLEEVQIAGNDTKKYSNLNFNGTETVGDNSLDITGMTHFNIDVWSPNFPVFKIKLVDFGADNAFTGGDDTEHEVVFEAPAQGEWITYSIPLTDFTGLTNKEHISQLIFATSDGASTVYVDNVYFSTATAGTEDFAAAKPMMYPNPASDALTIKSVSVMENVAVYNTLGQKVLSLLPNADEVTINVRGLQSGVYIVTTVAEGKVTTQKFMKQ